MNPFLNALEKSKWRVSCSKSRQLVMLLWVQISGAWCCSCCSIAAVGNNGDTCSAAEHSCRLHKQNMLHKTGPANIAHKKYAAKMHLKFLNKWFDTENTLWGLLSKFSPNCHFQPSNFENYAFKKIFVTTSKTATVIYTDRLNLHWAIWRFIEGLNSFLHWMQTRT